jgi:hypothetical protein
MLLYKINGKEFSTNRAIYDQRRRTGGRRNPSSRYGFASLPIIIKVWTKLKARKQNAYRLDLKHRVQKSRRLASVSKLEKKAH